LSDNIEEDWNTIKTSITKASDQVLGRSQPSPKNSWIDEECLKALKQKEEARNRNLDRNTRQTWQSFLVASKIAKKICRRKKRNWHTSKMMAIEHANSVKERFRNVKNLTNGFHPRSSAVRDSNGVLKTEVGEILKVWSSYFNDLLNQSDTNETSENSEARFKLNTNIAHLLHHLMRRCVKQLKGFETTRHPVKMEYQTKC
jgi:hypothetical protein